MTTTHTGTQEHVYSAIRGGQRHVVDIMRATGLEELAVRNAVRRLLDQDLIRNNGGYEPVQRRCLLAEVWR